MSEKTAPNLGLKHGWNLGESGWNSGLDGSQVRLDTVVQLSVKDRNLTVAPVTPTDGDRYIVAASATGIWAGKDNQVALWYNAAWNFYVPKVGWIAYIEDEQVISAYKVAGWSAGVAI